MTLLVPNAGANEMLARAVNKNASDNLKLRLYENNYTPVEASVVGDFTEATFSGYAAITLTGASWTMTTADPAVADYAQQTFTATAAGNSVYGYYVTNNAGTICVWAERFTDGPYTITGNGDVVKVTPTITGD